MLEEEFTTTIQKDLFRMMCGKQIGEGSARQVYDCAYDSSLVVKMENRAYSFQNVIEWNVWNDALSMPHARRWLAPCTKISACGTILLQKKTVKPVEYPDGLPVWLTDTKKQNYGLLDGEFVCHDYGVNLICNQGLSRRSRKVEWWDAENDEA